MAAAAAGKFEFYDIQYGEVSPRTIGRERATDNNNNISYRAGSINVYDVFIIVRVRTLWKCYYNLVLHTSFSRTVRM